MTSYGIPNTLLVGDLAYIYQNGTTSITKLAVGDSSVAAGGQVSMYIGKSSSANNGFFLSFNNYADQNAGNYFKILGYGYSTGGFCVTSSGNVGIGTTNPVVPLHVQGNMAFCMTYTPTKYYSYEWSVAANQAAGSVIFTFGNAGFYAKIILYIRDLSNSANFPGILSGEFTGGNVYTGTPGGNIVALSLNSRPSTNLNTGSVTYGTNTITIAISTAGSTGGTISARVELMGSVAHTIPNLSTIQYPVGTTVYTPGY